MNEKASAHLKNEELVAVLTAAVAVCLEASENQFAITGVRVIPNSSKKSAWSSHGLKSLMASRL